jgi:uncharacterized repeat protein (TIGR03803 family)
MRDKKLSIEMAAVLAILVVTLRATGAVAQTEIVLYSFNDKDGSGPAGLICDASGNLYGTTSGGGVAGGGTAFELTPQAGGGWTEKVLYSFSTHPNDRTNPTAALILDAAGNLYGTASTYDGYAYGAVFELTPKAGGEWTEKILYSFLTHPNDGWYPYAGLILDAAGNLYGTTVNGGAYGWGTVFELMPETGGGWGEKILLNFNGTDGGNPFNSLIFDAAGNLYGTTAYGGVYSSFSVGGGTAFELTPNANGRWTETVLHNFGGTADGNVVSGSLIFDAAGNLYGTTNEGGTGSCARYTVVGCGTAFELSPNSDASWSETVLYYFRDEGDGYWPGTGLIFDAEGNLYGTTQGGGFHGLGTVFKIAP